jgi:hypothetical protein
MIISATNQFHDDFEKKSALNFARTLIIAFVYLSICTIVNILWEKLKLTQVFLTYSSLGFSLHPHLPFFSNSDHAPVRLGPPS